MNTLEPPACLTCGVCCFSRLETYVRVTGDDHTRLGEHAEGLTHFIEHRCFMRMHEGHCAALLRTVEGEWACSVYGDRPELCRDLARAGPACGAERDAKGERPAQLLRVIGARARA